MKYKTIYLDPPWPEYGGGKICRGAQRHYPLMSIDEIKNLKSMILDLADPDGCHLYMWVTNNHIQKGLEIIEYWGFTYITFISWFKEGNIGLGQYFRGNTEHCIFARKGMLPYKIVNGKRAQGKTGFISKKSIHSRKPLEMYRQIELVSYPPRIELFARGIARSGWDIWGNQAEGNTLQNTILDNSETEDTECIFEPCPINGDPCADSHSGICNADFCPGYLK